MQELGANGRSRRAFLKAAGVAGLVGVAGCSSDGGEELSNTTTTTEDSVQAAMLYNTEVGDYGWTYRHHQAVTDIEEQFDWLEVSYNESLDTADVKSVAEQYARTDHDVVFGTSFGFQDGMYEAAEAYPDTTFEHCSGFRTRENMGRYFGRLYQAYFLTGVAAGMVTETNTLGFVGAFPIPEVVRFINAFSIGATSVNEEVRTKVRYLNTWHDPEQSRDGTAALIDEGADVIAGVMDSPSMVEAANDNGVWASGAWAPMRQYGGENYLTTPIFDWEPYYRQELEQIRNDEWASNFYYDGIASGVVDIDEFGPQVPDSVQAKVAEKRDALVDGTVSVWEGTKFEAESDTFLFSQMSSYVPSVQGDVPGPQ